MDEVRASMAIWQSVFPIATSIVVLVMMKLLSRHWTEAAAQRTARVVAKLGSRARRERAASGAEGT